MNVTRLEQQREKKMETFFSCSNNKTLSYTRADNVFQRENIHISHAAWLFSKRFNRFWRPWKLLHGTYFIRCWMALRHYDNCIMYVMYFCLGSATTVYYFGNLFFTYSYWKFYILRYQCPTDVYRIREKLWKCYVVRKFNFINLFVQTKQRGKSVKLLQFLLWLKDISSFLHKFHFLVSALVKLERFFLCW